MNAKIWKKETSHLYRVKQGKDESLKDYLSRFDKAIMQVKTCTDATLIDAFREGVKDKKLLWAMTYDAPLSFANLRGIAQKHYGTEEYIKSRNGPRYSSKQGEKKKRKDSAGQDGLPTEQKKSKQGPEVKTPCWEVPTVYPSSCHNRPHPQSDHWSWTPKGFVAV